MKKTKFQKASFIFQIWLLNEKMKNGKTIFLFYFDLKPISKNKNQNFQIHFLIWNQKMNFEKFFLFSILVIKLKNEKWKYLKVCFIFKSKSELYFRYTDFSSFNISYYMKKWKTKKILLKSVYQKYNSFFDLKTKWTLKFFHFSFSHFITKIEKPKNFLKFIFWFQNKKMNSKTLIFTFWNCF